MPTAAIFKTFFSRLLASDTRTRAPVHAPRAERVGRARFHLPKEKPRKEVYFGARIEKYRNFGKEREEVDHLPRLRVYLRQVYICTRVGERGQWGARRARGALGKLRNFNGPAAGRR